MDRTRQAILARVKAELNTVPAGRQYVVDRVLDCDPGNSAKVIKGLFSVQLPSKDSGKAERRTLALVPVPLGETEAAALHSELKFVWKLWFHPHVLTYHHIFVTSNCVAITCESSNVGTLHRFLSRISVNSGSPGLRHAAARFFFQQLVMLLHCCHGSGEALGGGISPENLVVCWNKSNSPVLKLASTGQSGLLSPAAADALPPFTFSDPHAIHNTAASGGADGDASAAMKDDIYRLGAMLFYLLTGRPPQRVRECETAEAWAARVSELDVVIPKHVANEEDLHNLLQGMLLPSPLRWTLAEIMAHPFFTSNLPAGALNMTQDVNNATVASKERCAGTYSMAEPILQRIIASCVSKAQESAAAAASGTDSPKQGPSAGTASEAAPKPEAAAPGSHNEQKLSSSVYGREKAEGVDHSSRASSPDRLEILPLRVEALEEAASPCPLQGGQPAGARRPWQAVSKPLGASKDGVQGSRSHSEPIKSSLATSWKRSRDVAGVGLEERQPCVRPRSASLSGVPEADEQGVFVGERCVGDQPESFRGAAKGENDGEGCTDESTAGRQLLALGWLPGSGEIQPGARVVRAGV